jgi:DNA-directed RNA polymerase specialized sigma24 family protein
MNDIDAAFGEATSVLFEAIACCGAQGGGMNRGGDPEQLDQLVDRVCEGDEAAWQALWCALDARLEGLVQRRGLIGRLSGRPDDRRGVVVLVMARLRQNDYQRLKMYRAERQRKPSLALMAWLAVVTKHVAVDYLRAHPDFVATRGVGVSDRRGEVVDPRTLPPGSRGPAARPPVTVTISGRQMLEWARENLPPPQYQALELRIEKDTADLEIARVLGLASAEDAQRLVRAAEARLRRQFRTGGGAP